MSKERFKCYYCDGIENIIVEDTINNETYIEDNIVNLLNQQDQRIAELEDKWNKIKVSIFDRCEFYNDLVEDGYANECSKAKQYLLNEIYDEMQELEKGENNG